MLTKAISQSNVQRVVKIFAGFMLMFAASQITIPIEPVPITLQTMAVMLIGITYGLNDGLSAIILYLVAGSIGMPVFANMSSGFNDPSAGYLIGFVACVYVMNKLKERLNIDSVLKIVLVCIFGNIPIFFFGIVWLSTFIGLKNAILHGFMPFIIPGIFKSILLGLSLKAIKFKVK